MTWLLLAATLILLVVGFIWFTRRVWFYRDPDHTKTTQNDDAVLSPVYGIVAYVRRISDGIVESEKIGERIRIEEITKDDWPKDYPNGDGWLIGIAMTALDVHYQYSPIPARILSICHRRATNNLPMFDLWEYVRITWLRKAIQLFARKYVFENERQTMWLSGQKAKIGLVLIADKFVNKITTFVSQNQAVPAGGKLSFIGRGSQVDLVICGHPNLHLLVSEGQPVRGPLTALARLSPDEPT